MIRTPRTVSIASTRSPSPTQAVVSVGAATYDPPKPSTSTQVLSTVGGDAMPKAVALGTAAGAALGLLTGGWMWAVGGAVLANLGGRVVAQKQCAKTPTAAGCPCATNPHAPGCPVAATQDTPEQ